MYLLIASIFPVIIFLYVIYQKDHEKEPFELLVKCFIAGCSSTLLSLILSVPFSLLSHFFTGSFLNSVHLSFFEAAIPEELSKFYLLYIIIWNRLELNHYYDGIVYAVFISLGFALVENVMYVLDGGLKVAIFRALLAVPGHGLFSVLMGYNFSLAKFYNGQKRKYYFLKSIFYPILFHGVYDFILYYMNSVSTNFPISALLLICFGVFVIKLWKRGIHSINKHIKTDQQTIKN